VAWQQNCLCDLQCTDATLETTYQYINTLRASVSRRYQH
jgi:hypothetical protein